VSLFVDTSIWYAAADSGDPGNSRARRLLAETDEPLTTTDHILVETWTLLRYRIHKGAAESFWDALRRGVAAIEPVRAADLETAWSIGEAFPDQDFSLVDRTSFAVMQRLGLRRVATFDDDFAVFRFGRDRNLAFDVIR